MKYYFCPDIDELMCFTLNSIKDQMKFNGLKEAECFEAKMVIGEGFFFCSEFQEVGETGETCGKFCDKYAPRNGKSGRCKHHKNTYEPSNKSIIIKL